MAYTYLEIVNKILRRFNETELTSASFATSAVIGFPAAVKDFVNEAILDIQQEGMIWPWNHVEYDETAVAGTIRYALPSNYEYVLQDSFRVQQDDTIGNDTQRLEFIEYGKYLKRIDAEYETDTGIRALPTHVTLTPDEEFAIWPPPNAAYTITYDYFKEPTELTAATDVPEVPERYRNVLLNLVSWNCFIFRSNDAMADRLEKKAEDGLKDMRKIVINKYDSMESKMISRTTLTSINPDTF